MKKTLIAGVMFFALATPLLASAQVDVNASTAASTTQQAYQYSLRQVISLLMKQVEVLIAQLATLNAQQTNLQSQIQTLTTNGIISTPAPVYGASNPTPVQSEDKTSLTVELKQIVKPGEYADSPFGAWKWTVVATDKDGNPIGNGQIKDENGQYQSVPLIFSISKDGTIINDGLQTDSRGNRVATTDLGSILRKDAIKHYISAQGNEFTPNSLVDTQKYGTNMVVGQLLTFAPISAGNYSLTFTANGLSKTIDVVVN